MTQDYLQTTTHTIAWLKNASEASTLDMTPPFQRNPVWTDAQKSYLIETILKGYPVPEIYLQTSSNEHGVERHVVVDGQQRIRACLEYTEGDYSLTGLSDRALADKVFDELTPEQRTTIFNYKLVVRLLPELSDDEIRAIFQRLNRNVVALSRQELRHATYWGPFITSVEALARLEFWRTSGIFTANEIRRMLDIEYVSELVIGMIHGPQNKKTSLERFYAAYEEEFEYRDLVESLLPVVLAEIAVLLPDLNKTRWRKKSDFYTLFLYLYGLKQVPDESMALTMDQVRGKLLEFATLVDELVSLDSPVDGQTSAAGWSYARAVQRAASDLANRRARAAALASFMTGVDGPIVFVPLDEEIDIEEDPIVEDDYDEE